MQADQEQATEARRLGPLFNPHPDAPRLQAGMAKVLAFTLGPDWRTLRQIERATGVPQASASAHLRHLTRAEWGGYIKQRRKVPGQPGLHEYRLMVSAMVDTEDRLRRRHPAVEELRAMVSSLKHIRDAIKAGNDKQAVDILDAAVARAVKVKGVRCD